MRTRQLCTLLVVSLIGSPAVAGDCARQASASAFLQCVKTEIAARSGGCGQDGETRIANGEQVERDPGASRSGGGQRVAMSSETGTSRVQ